MTADAVDLLPYGQRTKGYSGTASTARGDIRTVGMAGATTGLADSLIGSFYNPAGLAMTLPTSRLKAAGNLVFDKSVQNDGMSSSLLLGGGHLYPWGFSFGYLTTNSEGQNYILPSGKEVGLEVSTTEFQFSVARLFFQQRLAIGAGLVMGRATREIFAAVDPDNGFSDTSYSFGYRVGALYQFPGRVLVGMSYKGPLEFDGDLVEAQGLDLPGFYQFVNSPWRFDVGFGWILNRFFRAGYAISVEGIIQDAALLSDESQAVGEDLTFQPKVGVHYLALEFKNLEVELMGGSYFETSRIDDRASRLHLTTGIEVSPWIFDFGVGLDVAARYKNYIFSVGIHPIRTLRALGWIPKKRRKFAYGGAFPSILKRSEKGLPRALVRNPRNQEEGTNLRELRDNIQKEFGKAVEKIESTLGTVEEEEALKKSKNKTQKKKKTYKKKSKKKLKKKKSTR